MSKSVKYYVTSNYKMCTHITYIYLSYVKYQFLFAHASNVSLRSITYVHMKQSSIMLYSFF